MGFLLSFQQGHRSNVVIRSASRGSQLRPCSGCWLGIMPIILPSVSHPPYSIGWCSLLIEWSCEEVMRSSTHVAISFSVVHGLWICFPTFADRSVQSQVILEVRSWRMWLIEFYGQWSKHLFSIHHCHWCLCFYLWWTRADPRLAKKALILTTIISYEPSPWVQIASIRLSPGLDPPPPQCICIWKRKTSIFQLEAWSQFVFEH